MKHPFWKTVPFVLVYKRALAVALVGAGISAACFGAGIGMMLPVFTLLLGQKKSVAEIVRGAVNDPSLPGIIREPLARLADAVPPDPFVAFLVTLGVVGVLTLIGSAGRYLHEVTVLTVCERAAMSLRARLFRRFLHAPLDLALQRGSADATTRTVVDVRTLARGHQAILAKAVGEVLKGVAALALALALDWLLALLALLGAPVIAVLLRKFGKSIRRASKAVLQQNAKVLAAMQESLSGLRTVKTHQAEGYERRRFATLSRSLFRQEMRMRQARALSSPSVETIAIFGVMAVAAIAAWYIFRQNVEPQRFMTVLFALVAAGASLKPLTALHNQLREADAAAARVLEALQLPVERHEGVDLPPPRSRILFDDVTYAYPGAAEPALRGVTLEVACGQTVAVVGGNGSGKTTLMSLLPRLIDPASGRVLFDDADLATGSLRSVRRPIAVVSQQSVLFAGTIAENIAYGRRHVPRERIVEAARAAYAHEFIAALPRGYDAALAEGGEGLSGGQRQRLCIARAILRDPAILILDEATSQIDSDSEAKINTALQQFRRGRTTFIIAHRLATVVDADLIVVMDAGRIIARGTHAELLSTCPTYQALVRTQLTAADAA